MTIRKNLLLLLVVLGIFSACKDEEPLKYVGTNYIYLNAEKDPVLTIGESGAIEVRLRSAQRAIRDTRFEFAIKALDEQGKADWVKIKESEVVLKEGERELLFHIVANAAAKPNVELSQYELTIEQLPDEAMKLQNALRFRLLNVEVPALTETQKKFIEGYKAKGIDITPFLGKVDVKTTVRIPADGYIVGFNEPTEKTYEGFSVFTLSEKATAEKPVLKMVYNAMGMNEFFYFAMRKETIENDEYWYGEYAGPLYKDIRELINWNKESVETFSTSLDNLRIGEKSGDKYNIEFLGEGKDSYDDPITIVPFEFDYSAWNRQKKLIDEGNLKAIECHEGGASAMPGRYINQTDITEDGYESDDYTFKPVNKGEWLVGEKKMQFAYYTSVQDAGWYITVTTEYSAD